MVDKLVSRQCEDRVFGAMEQLADEKWKELMSVDEELQRKIRQNEFLLANMIKAKKKLSNIDMF